MPEKAHGDDCLVEQISHSRLDREIPAVVDELVGTCQGDQCLDHISPVPLPSLEAMERVVQLGRRIIFPGYLNDDRLESMNLRFHLGQDVARFFDLLSNQITLAIRHDCVRYDAEYCNHCIGTGQEKALALVKALPELRRQLAGDVRAAREGDPASGGLDEIIFSYPGVLAMTVHRLAHLLYHLEVPLLPRILSEYAHGKTGIDIHPGAHIGENFFMDHGTGVVIGQTAVIGDRVRIYQGVTLGALSLPRDAMPELRAMKRHPTIEDDVVVYAGATILGGDTVVGARSVIGGNVWLTQSVPPDTKVFVKAPELIYKGAKPAKE